jgi:phosphoesterase RecJ-like protein
VVSTAPSTLDPEYAVAAGVVASLPKDATILLTCHVSPDGDALGSMLGFGLALRGLGFAQVRATFPEPYEVPEPFRFLPGLDLLVRPGQVTEPPELGMSFDASNLGRLSGLVPTLSAARTWIVLDHHASNTGFGGVRLIDPDAAATAVVAANLLDRLGVVLDRDVATCLYLGLAMDTGSFRFSSTTADVHRLAARLVAAGADPATVARQVFDNRPYPAMRLLSDILGRLELDPGAAHGRGLVTTYATMADLARYGLTPQVVDGYLDVVRTVAEADVTCMLKPVTEGEWAVSLRSKGATDVARIAVGLGGGGHRLAAGFTGYGAAGHVIAQVRARLELQSDPG